MSNNPLKQYFRRPAIYLKLPSQGKYYNEEIIDFPENQELPVYPMTAIDEITSRTPDALYNGSAVIDIIKSCIPAIKNPWKINNIDLDAILIAIRIASNGDELDVMSTCPSCDTESKYGVNLVEVLSKKTDIDYSKALKLHDLEIKFRPLTYKEINKNSIAQYEVQKMLVFLEDIEDGEEKNNKTKETLNHLQLLMSEAISNTIEYIKTPESLVDDNTYIQEFLNNCDRKTNNLIKETSLKLRNKNDIKPLRIKCINCQHEYQQSLVLNMSDFFG